MLQRVSTSGAPPLTALAHGFQRFLQPRCMASTASSRQTTKNSNKPTHTQKVKIFIAPDIKNRKETAIKQRAAIASTLNPNVTVYISPDNYGNLPSKPLSNRTTVPQEASKTTKPTLTATNQDLPPEKGEDQATTSVLDTNASGASWEDVEAILEGVGIQPSIDTATEGELATVKDPKALEDYEARRRLNDIVEVIRHSPHAVTSSDLLFVLRQNGLKKLDQAQTWALYNTITTRAELSKQININDYTVILRGLCGRVSLESSSDVSVKQQMTFILRDMKSRGIAPDVNIFCCLLRAYRDDTRGIEGVLKHLENAQVPLTQELVQTKAILFARHERLRDKLQPLFEDMKTHRLRPTPKTLCVFLTAFTTIRNETLIMKTHSLLKVLYEPTWDRNVYNSLMMAWAQFGKRKVVERLYGELRGKNITPNRDTYKALLRLYYQMNFWRAIVSLYNNRLLFHKIPLDDECWKYVAAAYGGLHDYQGLKGKVQRVIKSQLLDGYTSVTFKSLVLCCDVWSALSRPEVEDAFNDLKEVKNTEYEKEGKVGLEWRPPKTLLANILHALSIKINNWDKSMEFVERELYNDHSVRYHFVKALKKEATRDDEVYRVTTLEPKQVRNQTTDLRKELLSYIPKGPYENIYKHIVDKWLHKAGKKGEYMDEGDATALVDFLKACQELQERRVNEVMRKYEIQIET